MRSVRVGRLAAVAGAVLLGLSAAAQEEERPGRNRPDREGRVPGGPGGAGGGMKDPRMLMQMQARAQGQAPAMAVSEGKLFIVLGRELRRLDARTLVEEKKADIPVPGADDEAQRKRQAEFLARFDRNKDGAIGEDEFPRPEILKRFDANGDGKVTAEEAPGPQTMAARMPAGPATLLVEKGSVYVFQGGSLYRFDGDSLELAATAELVPQPAGGPGGQEMPGGWKGGGRAGDRPGFDRRGRDFPLEEPEVPEDPVRF